MSIQFFDRPPREALEKAPSGKVSLPEAVAVPRIPALSTWQRIGAIVMLIAVAILIYVLVQIRQGWFSILPVMMLVMYVSMILRHRGNRGDKQSWGEMENDCQDWFNLADKARDELISAAEKQFSRAWRCHPDPHDLVGLAGSAVTWERRRTPTDDFKDFGHVRLGVGTVKQAMQIEVPPLPQQPMYVEPATSHGKRKFLREQRYIHDMPRVVSLTKTKAMSLVGPLDEVRGLARAAICQLAQWHVPDDLKIIVVTDRPEVWEWLKWLPHVQDSGQRDGCGERRMLFTSPEEYETYFADAIRDRGIWKDGAGGPKDHVTGSSGKGRDPFWVVIDDACGSETDWQRAAPKTGIGGVCFIRLAESVGSGEGLGFTDKKWVYRVEDGVIRRSDVDASRKMSPADDEEGGMAFYAVADSLSVQEAERFAAALAPFRLGKRDASERAGVTSSGGSLLEFMGITDGRVLDKERLYGDRWKSSTAKREGSNLFRFPVATDDMGKVVEMDLKESAHQGWNMNGLIVGTTGSGKSHAIATIIISQLLTHPPEVLSTALFDLKAKSIAQKFEDAPNVIACVSNLQAEKHLIRRMHLALAGLFDRRKEAVTAAGCTHIEEYNAKIGKGEKLPRIPALQVIIDEFNELPGVYPEIYDFLDQLVRQGRSYDMFLLLVGQTYNVPQLAQKIDSVLGYRIALRCGKAELSRQVIDDPIAYTIPSKGAEGVGYLKVGSDTIQKIRFFNTMAEHVPMVEVDEQKVIEAGNWFEPREFSVVAAPDVDKKMAPPPIPVRQGMEPAAKTDDDGPKTETETVIEALGGAQARPLIDFWLPPLKDGLAADELVRRLRGGKPWKVDYGSNPGLVLPVGQEDRPYDCTQPITTMDLRREQHWAIAGGVKSGLSTAMATAVLGGALLYRPEAVQFYCISGSNSPLWQLRSLPHVAGMAQDHDESGIVRVLDSVIELINFRSRKFQELDISAGEFLARRAADPNAYPEIEGGEIVLVVEDFVKVKTKLATAREDRFLPRMVAITQNGSAAAVHVVISSVTHGHSFHNQVATNVNGRLELTLSKGENSSLNRVEADLLPKGERGWGISPSGYRMRVGLPQVTAADGSVVADSKGLAAVFQAEVGATRSTTMARLPAIITAAELQAKAPGQVVVALRERDLAPVVWNLKRNPHLAVVGRPESGRTTFLRSAFKSITEVYSPDEARVHVIDFKKQNGGMFDRAYMDSYSLTSGQARKAMQALAGELVRRRPPDDVELSPEEAATRRFWEGPEIFVVIDNAELLPTYNSPDYPFAPERGATPMEVKPSLVNLLQEASQLGFHVMYSAQLNQAFALAVTHNPLFSTLRNMYSPTMILDGDPALPVIASNVRPVAQERPGKGLWVETELVGTALAAWTEEPEQQRE
ncbi:type VII secretion protein EccCa [Mycolicibacterium mageritense]|uniref:type VII secretion protein EccCa n=1 Tax=Mycolicibacterium mageritense TaxID=53462 RepID=UPI0011D7A579|nr:type VII secretion protein EccCa [Mycolicibacterium mageritense]TXI55757.1 MAG: type VII secretion protein EccCa [Mycolicibacterium mageritense]